MPPARAFLFLSSSARPNGNTLWLARQAARHLPTKAAAYWQDLHADPLPAFLDTRPNPTRPIGRAADLLATTTGASDIVLVAPVYWYALPAPAKLYLDHVSGWLDLPEPGLAAAFRAKTFWLITARADPDRDVTRPVEDMARSTARWLGAAWGGALHGIGDAPGDIAADAAALAEARRFFTDAARPWAKAT